MRVKMSLVCLVALGVLIPSAGAEPYWYAYEGNDLPENEGWERFWGNDDGAFEGDGSIRTVENGVLTMDSMYSLRTYDYACHYLYGELDPDPGELFVAEWRAMVEESEGDGRDSMMVVATDEAMQLAFGLFPDHIESKWEDDVTLPVSPGEFHDYRIESWDMQTYDLYIDDALAHQGTFWQGLLLSKFAWGDGVRGASSLAQWDYVRYGVLPEPCSITLIIIMCACATRRA